MNLIYLHFYNKRLLVLILESVYTFVNLFRNCFLKNLGKRFLFLIILIIPNKNALIPEMAARRNGIVNNRLLKNVSPPRSPEATSRKKDNINKKKSIIRPINHLPGQLFGIVLIFIIIFSKSRGV